MKRLLFTGAVLAVLPGASWGQNLLTNPGFEMGDFTGWFEIGGGKVTCAYHQPDEHSGLYCYCCEACCGSFAEVCAEQTVATSPGILYSVGGWMKGCESAVAQLYADGSTCGSVGTPFASDLTCAYTQYQTEVTGVSSITLMLYCPGSIAWDSSSVHWDDLEVVATSVGDWVLY